jgi:hypothetical protein
MSGAGDLRCVTAIPILKKKQYFMSGALFFCYELWVIGYGRLNIDLSIKNGIQ